MKTLIQCALEAGVGAENMTLVLTVDLINGDPQAHRLFVDLEKSGARLTRSAGIVTAHVDYAAASRFQQLQQFGDLLVDPVARG